MEYKLIITVDTNDGDYVTQMNTIDQETLDLVRPLFELMAKTPSIQKGTTTITYGERKGEVIPTYASNWSRGDYVDDDDTEAQQAFYTAACGEDAWYAVDDLMPYPEYGFHMVERVVFHPVVEETKLV